MCVRLSGFFAGSSSATSSRSNLRECGILGPERYSASADRSELGICHETSSGTVVLYYEQLSSRTIYATRLTFGSDFSSVGVISSGVRLAPVERARRYRLGRLNAGYRMVIEV